MRPPLVLAKVRRALKMSTVDHHSFGQSAPDGEGYKDAVEHADQAHTNEAVVEGLVGPWEARASPHRRPCWIT